MTKNIIKDGETPRKQKLENSDSEKVRGFQRGIRERENERIWQHGYNMGVNRGIEEATLTIRRSFPNIFLQEEPNENPDAGMEERERLMAEEMDD